MISSASEIPPSVLQAFYNSDPRCGYCDRALREIGEWAIDKPIDVIAMDVSEKAEKLRENAKLQFYSEYNIHIVDASPCGMRHKKFIPKIYVFDGDSRLLLKVKGWDKDDLSKFKRKVARHL